MLVLTRKASQAIVIGDDIEITVLAVTATHVKIGIAAPREVPVHRKEIYVELDRSTPAASGSSRRDVDEALGRLRHRR